VIAQMLSAYPEWQIQQAPPPLTSAQFDSLPIGQVQPEDLG